jgi:tripartite-type tricarboxylate transporter receptor subunit TctC
MTTIRRHFLLAAACGLFSIGAVAADTYPVKPIHFIVPFQAGGESDIVARQIASKLGALRGYTIVVDNYAGAGGNLGAEKALREPADGYTLLVISGAYAGNAVVQKPNFDPAAAIQPVILFARQPSVLVANPKYDSIGALLDAARKSPGSINYGSAGVGSLGNLTTEEFAAQAHVKLNQIPYKGNSGAINDLAGGRTDMMLAGLSGAEALAKTGSVKLLAVGGDHRLASHPEVPTFAESGLPDFKEDLWHGLVASKDVPPAIVAQLNSDLNAVLKDPEVIGRFSALGLTPAGGTPEQFKQLIRGDMQRMQVIVKQADIKIQ